MQPPKSDADIHRSKPGYVYDFAIHSSRQEEGTPSCPCSCHLADSPRGAKGWYCDRCYAYIMVASWPEPERRVDYSHAQAIEDGTSNPRPYMVNVPDYYFVTKGNTLSDELGEHFDTEEEAKARVKELNDADALASLKVPRSHRERFARFRELVGERYHWSTYGDSHPLTCLPRKPGRYAVEESSDEDSWWTTYETMAEVEETVLTGDAWRIIDLDTGQDIPFKLSAQFGQEVAAMREP